MSEIKFNIRWREELEAVTSDKKLIFEITMGQLHVYFPTESRWAVAAPAWAKDEWKMYADSCTVWCAQNRIPISFVDDAYVSEEKV